MITVDIPRRFVIPSGMKDKLEVGVRATCINNSNYERVYSYLSEKNAVIYGPFPIDNETKNGVRDYSKHNKLYRIFFHNKEDIFMFLLKF